MQSPCHRRVFRKLILASYWSEEFGRFLHQLDITLPAAERLLKVYHQIFLIVNQTAKAQSIS
jgi:hypothetical protein